MFCWFNDLGFEEPLWGLLWGNVIPSVECGYNGLVGVLRLDGEVTSEIDSGFGRLIVAYIFGGHTEAVRNVEHEGGEAVRGGDGG